MGGSVKQTRHCSAILAEGSKQRKHYPLHLDIGCPIVAFLIEIEIAIEVEPFDFDPDPISSGVYKQLDRLFGPICYCPV
jgi:hypothetical protein